MVKIPMKCQAHNTRPALKTVFGEVLLGEYRVLAAHVAVITVVGFDGDDLAILYQRLEHAMRVTATVTLARGIDSFCTFIPAPEP